MRPRRNVFRLLVAAEAVVLIAVILFGIVQMAKPKTKSVPVSQEEDLYAVEGDSQGNLYTEESAQADSGVSEMAGEVPKGGEQAQKELQPVVFSEEVQAKLTTMTLEEKVAQMFLVTPEALTHNDSVEVAGEGTKNAIHTYPVGGMVYSSLNFQDKEQTQKLLSGVQQYSVERIGLPLFLAVEEAGGNEGSPLAIANEYELQRSPLEIGAGGHPEEAAQSADSIASYLAEEGFNMNLAPLADLAGGADGVHDSKCFGNDAANVSMMVAESVNAFHGKGIKTAVGMFPGKGNVSNITKEWTEWENSDALPFQSAVNAGTECIRVGNVTCESLTGDAQTLCSLSREAVYYLRNDMGYTGILMTDSLSEEAVTGKYSPGEAAVEAVKAGMNLLYCPADFEAAYQAVLDAVDRGEISEEVIEQAAGYILMEKM